ncbi:hypothetical protein L204_105352 [Cryptococcus depauperatus]
MLLYLVRHAETSLNNANRIHGSINEPLSPGGHSQAKKLAEHLRLVPFTEAYTSPLKRAEETAKEVLKYQSKITLYVDERLRARNMGSAEGQIWEDVCKDLDKHKIEDEAILKKRLCEWLDSLIKIHTPSASTSSTPALLSPTYPVIGNVALNPFDLIKALPRPGMPRTPSVPSGGGLGSGVILVLTHQECLTALIDILTSSSAQETQSEPKSPIDLHVPEGFDFKSNIANTSVAILRVWWEEGENGLEARGRVEAWGVQEHLELMEEQ